MIVLTTVPLVGQTPTLLRDIHAGEESSGPFGAIQLSETRWVFAATDPVHGREPWVTDGTIEGTRLVKDILSGSDTSLSSPFGSGTRFGIDGDVLDQTLYFRATDGVNGHQIWRTDGSGMGAHPITTQALLGGSALGVTATNDAVFFQVVLSGRPQELWVSRGQPDDARLVRQFATGVVGLRHAFGELVLFWLFSSSPETEGLWRSDGTPGGTFRIAELGLVFTGRGIVAPPIAFENRLYFSAWREDTGIELWRTDGTTSGTELVLDIHPGPADSIPEHLTVFDGRFFFVAEDGVHGVELWSSDGTAAGTQLAADIDEGPASSFPGPMVALDGHLYFGASAFASLARPNRELWRTDGTASGTVRVRDINQTLEGFGSSDPEPFVVAGRLMLTADDGVHGRELWTSDGTAAGTQLVADLRPGPLSSLGTILARPTDPSMPLLFSANDGESGGELWALDTTCFFQGEPLVLQADRFAVDACWRGQHARSGSGQPVSVGPRSGAFSFFGPGNIELGVKILDGRPVNGHFWTFVGSLTNLETRLRITDRSTGQSRLRRPEGPFASLATLMTFAPTSTAASGTPKPPGPPWPVESGSRGAVTCPDDHETLCLVDGRFAVRVEWDRPDGSQGGASAFELGLNNGYFSFSRPDAADVMVKILDGRPVNDHYWFMAGALSTLRYVITVTDTATGSIRRYVHERGTFRGVGDIRAFPDP